MKIAIIGRTKILYETSKFLLSKGHEIKIIITAKESPEDKNVSRDFEKLAKNIDARFLFTSRISDKENINFIRSVGIIDIGVSMNYINVISQEAIDLFPYGILNAHGGDLPRYRGNACQAWAIINGEKRIAVCIHKMIGGELDSGDIIMREFKEINSNSKVGDLWQWMSERTPQLFLMAISKLENDKEYVLEKQSKDPKDSFRCYPRIPEDGKIDWSKSNFEILRLINASGKPYSGAYAYLEGNKITIWCAELFCDDEQYCAVPGQICYVAKDYFIVITGKGKLRIDNWKCKKKVKSIRQRLG